MYSGSQPALWQLHSALDTDDEDEVLGRVYDRRVVTRLPRYLAMVKTWMVLGTLGTVLRSLASLALPYLVAVAVDRFIQTGDLAGLNIVVGAFVVASLLVWAGQYMEERFLSFAGDRVLLVLRTEMFDHLQRLSLGFFDRNKVGKIMSRVQSDVQQLQQLITGGVLNIVTSVITLLGIAAAMFLMNMRLALLSLAVLPALAVATLVWQRHARRAFARVRRAIATVNAHLQESISGVRVVQGSSREDINLRQFDSANKRHLDANISAARLMSVTMPAVEILSAGAMALVVGIGGLEVLDGRMGIGALLGFLLYVQRFFNPVLELAAEYTELQRAMVAGVRIFELLDVEPEIRDQPDAVELPRVRGQIRFNQVSFAYDRDTEILHEVDLTISPGETVAIVGRTGAGKSSLVNLLARFYDVTKGKVTVDGHDVRSVTQRSLRRQMGIVPQDPFLFSGTIEDNIRYGSPGASRQDVARAARVAGAHDFIARLERGYEATVGERGTNLSAGQRQFICLARAVLSDQPILILDEATSNVDTVSEHLMQRSLQRVMRGRTCIIIAHRLATVAGAHRIIVLDQGRIVEEGPHEELMEKRGLYYHMVEASAAPDRA